MVGETHFRDVKGIDADTRTVENEVYLAQGGMAWMRWGVEDIGVFHAGGGKKEIEFPAAPEGVEIPGNDNFLVDIAGEGVQLFQLVLAVPIF